MTDNIKELSDIGLSDFDVSPVWEHANDREEDGETPVRPVFGLPVDTLGNRFVGCRVKLANGMTVPAIISNVSEWNPRATRQFITLSVYRNSWFDLARYHDVDAARRSPARLAKFLGFPIDQIFPISYDLRKFCVGDPSALCGTIESEPQERLNDAEIIALALDT